MRIAISPLIAAASFAFCMATVKAQAEPISFTPSQAKNGTGDLTAQIPVQSIGRIALPQGVVVINGHSIELQAVPEWLFDREPVLTGAVIKVSANTVGADIVYKGLAYFTDGTWIRSLAKPLDRDLIETKSGAQITGNIQAVLSDGVEVLQLAGGRRKVLFDEIEDLSSTRAWSFTVTARSIKLDPASLSEVGDARLVRFASTLSRVPLRMARAKVPESKLPGTEGGVSNTAIALWSLIDLGENVVAPAVATPIIFSSRDQTARQLLQLFGARSSASNTTFR